MGNVRLFLDETCPKDGGAELLAVAAVAVFKSQWHSYLGEWRSFAGLGERRRLEAVREFVRTRRFRAVIVGSRLDVLGASPQSTDDYIDVGRLSRRDRIWVQTMGSAVVLLTRSVLENGWNAARFDVFYDPKSLAKAHKELVEVSVPKVVERQLSLQAKRAVTVGKTEAVTKGAKGGYNELAEGTELAHWIAKLPNYYGQGELPANIEFFDVSHSFT